MWAEAPHYSTQVCVGRRAFSKLRGAAGEAQRSGMLNSLAFRIGALLLAASATVTAEVKTYRITGIVSSVGADLGTAIDGISPVFADADRSRSG